MSSKIYEGWIINSPADIPNPFTIDDIALFFKDTSGDFLTLEPPAPVSGTEFIQCAYLGEDSMTVEICRIVNETQSSIYGINGVTRADTFEMLKNYVENALLPDMSNWGLVTDVFR